MEPPDAPEADTTGARPPQGPGSDAEALLNALEPIGWRLGLDRMTALCDELGRPQDSFRSIHVVGTNGKSSVARMGAALLEAHGLRSGCLVSPHFVRWSERVLVAGRELPEEEFATSVRRAAEAARTVNANIGPDDAVTQFELAVASGFVALAEAGVEAATIEAGLGGRLDATNTLHSSVTVLTSIGLDHTEWLGDTELEIAGEKLAVLRPGSTLVIGQLEPEIEELARRTAAERECRVLDATDGPGSSAWTRGSFQHRNLAVAVAAVNALLQPDELSPEEIASVNSLTVPGRLERVASDPPVFVDVAHNPQGASALCRALPAVASGPVFGLIAVLSEKDADGILRALAPVLESAVFIGLPSESLQRAGRSGAGTRDPADLAAIAERLGLPSGVEPDATAGLSRVRRLAADSGGTVLVVGSHYLIAALGGNWQ